ncbi:DUF3370 domain-containing protein [cf. Phormidesmis sp. LEGE 11477]|uniref:DUF3370 domain-containing protein n=1 Tax=cf. Phormidesmis sp. LEGE 11477 TaxID=1828680 RepID=UPI0018818FE4|nr:DUF3370 domain-containing protein [cf. Phormidesmis sp. LEGE 11477]MBE9060507.1 DUF3370 domain-containing protein [cf. Phormidesmis sp. LEGE 11477]
MLAWFTALTFAQTFANAQLIDSHLTNARLTSPPPSQLVAQSPPAPTEFVVEQSVRPLPGAIDNVPVFNSNSPELVEDPGILLSTFPPAGMAVPEAHLDFPFSGRFDVFAHHVYKALDYDEENPELLDSLYIGILVNNPGTVPVNVRVNSGASYLSQPDAPFIQIPDFVPFSPLDPVYAGPGSRVAGDMLQDRLQQDIFPTAMVIPPGESRMLMNQPIPIRELEPPINGRSTLAYLESDGPVYVASMAQFALTEAGADGNIIESAPTLASWESLLQESGLAGPRDLAPAPLPLAEGERLIYGRVAGVSQGSEWQATLTDDLTSDQLTIPSAGESFSYGISLLYAGRMGTDQNQSAEMLVRYPDTAYESHGNYGVRYSLTLPLQNPTDQTQTVTVALETAIKEDTLSEDGLRFFEPLPVQTFFRGPVQVRYQSDRGLPTIRNIHLVMKRGQQGTPLATLTLPPMTSRTVDVSLIYPADSTPPQVLTVKTDP